MAIYINFRRFFLCGLEFVSAAAPNTPRPFSENGGSKTLETQPDRTRPDVFQFGRTATHDCLFAWLSFPKRAPGAVKYACGKTAPAEAFLRRRGRETDALLLETLSAAEPDKRLSPVETAVFRLFAGDKDAAEKIIENVPDSDLSRYAKARKRFVQGWLFLRDGDMLSASACAAEAVSLFEREKAFVEEAQALLLSGTVYRLSCVEDVAKFMFDAAAGLFRSYGDAVGEAEAVGNCGMLWTLQEKFAEAADDFAQALKLSLTAGAERLAAGLLNQQALLNILQRRYTEARRCLEQSEKISRRLNSVSGLAFSAELSAHVFYARKKRDKAAAAAAKAAGYYRRDGNLAACFESLYLQALALFENGETARLNRCCVLSCLRRRSNGLLFILPEPII